jgi:hypothetical protein
MDSHNNQLDLLEPTNRIWSLHSAEIPFLNGNDEPDYHSFLLLTENAGSKTHILNEMHFAPVINKKYGPQGTTFIGAVVYTGSDKIFSDLRTVLYDQGSPCRILNIWNEAIAAAIEISALAQHPFMPGDCRAGAKTVIECLGYCFQTFDHVLMQKGLDTALGTKISVRRPIETGSAVTIYDTYEALREKLMETHRDLLRKKVTNEERRTQESTRPETLGSKTFFKESDGPR